MHCRAKFVINSFPIVKVGQQNKIMTATSRIVFALVALIHFSVGVDLDVQEKFCPFGLYYGQMQSNCICLHEGLWAIQSDFCQVPSSLVGVKLNGTYCIRNGENKVL
jgi:hypothetical protein